METDTDPSRAVAETGGRDGLSSLTDFSPPLHPSARPPAHAERMKTSLAEMLGWVVLGGACVADLASNVYFSLFTKVEHPLTIDFPYVAPAMIVGAVLLAWGRRSPGWLAWAGLLGAILALNR